MDQRVNYIGTPAGVVLCIDKFEEGNTVGRLYHAYSPHHITIVGAETMLLIMDELFDMVGYPYPGTNRRTFKKSTDTHIVRKERVIKVMKDEELLERHGDLGTFIIRVQHRQNSSWQGSVTWVEEKKTENFRSALELIRMIDEAMGEEGSARSLLEGQQSEEMESGGK